MTIRNISDTARWVAFYRAMESDRPDAIFRDPWARALAGEQGEAIVDAMPAGRRMAWAMIVRTAVMDEIILDCVRERGADLVLNLAAGLDARPWRLDLPASLRWVDVDLPGILDYKAGVIGDAAPRCEYRAERADLADDSAREALFDRLAAEGRRALVVTEGLLVYLPGEAVAALARSLHRRTGFRWWLADLASPALLARIQKQWGAQVGAGNAPFRWAPAEGSAWFEPHGWREALWRATVDEAFRLGRTMPSLWPWRILRHIASARRREQVRRFSGIVLLERH